MSPSTREDPFGIVRAEVEDSPLPTLRGCSCVEGHSFDDGNVIRKALDLLICYLGIK
jgi:hypothetical protein